MKKAKVSLNESVIFHKNFATYSQFNPSNKYHKAVKIITDLFGLDWLTKNNNIFSFRIGNKIFDIKINAEGIIDLLLLGAE